ncbi:MAG TPA: hypothetical protein VFZ40_02590 [Pyrinomonadaceae bacterium]
MEADTRIIGNVHSARTEVPALGRALNLQSFWAIADQGVVSLGNFLSTIILARALTPTAYGVYAVVLGLILLLNVLPASLISYPLSVRLAARDDSSAAELVIPALALTALLALPQILVLFAASMLISSKGLGLSTALCLLVWQLQETTRRALMARLAFSAALITDAISYLGQAALMWLLARNGQLTLEVTFGVIGMTCGLAAIAQLWLLRARWRMRLNLIQHASAFWMTGRWVLGTNLLANFNIQAVPLAIFLFRGPADAAGFQAVSNLIGISHPIMLSLGNFLIPAVARVRAREGLVAARRIAVIYSGRAGLLLLPLFLLLLILPQPLLGLFYGAASPYVELAWPLRLFAFAYAVTYWAMVTRFFLIALEAKNRAQFLFEVCWSVTFIALLIPLTVRWSLAGAIIATTLSQGTRIVSNLMLTRRLTPESEPPAIATGLTRERLVT